MELLLFCPSFSSKKQVMKLSSCFLFSPPLFNETANMGYIYLVYGDDVTISQEITVLVVVVCVHTLSVVHYRGQTSFTPERKMNGILQYHPGSFLITNITSQLGITTRQVQHWQGVQPSAWYTIVYFPSKWYLFTCKMLLNWGRSWEKWWELSLPCGARTQIVRATTTSSVFKPLNHLSQHIMHWKD